MSIGRFAPARPCRSLAGVVSALLLLAVSSQGSAAPVAQDDAAEAAAPVSDPYVLATQWTLNALTPSWIGQTPDVAPMTFAARAAPAPAWSPFSGVVGPIEGTRGPRPTAFLWLGAALLVAGIAARRLARRQRGFSKKT